ncbi:MAG: hypothetical protein R3F24_09985 [Gammaproteobacteria bacterium]
MSSIAIGKKVPNFKLPATGGKTVDPKPAGSNVVIYFIPETILPGLHEPKVATSRPRIPAFAS